MRKTVTLAKTEAPVAAGEVGAAPVAAPRLRLGSLRTSVPLPSGKFFQDGGDAWLELQPFPHVRVGRARYAMDKVITWSMPGDLARKVD